MPAKHPTNTEEAKTYACKATAGELSLDRAQRQLDYFRQLLATSITDEQKAVWHREIERVETWLASASYQDGEYARGIDDLLLELIEWRALIYAFHDVETEASPFNQHLFFSQWLIGGAYATFALLGQLVSKDARDNSLRKLWKDVSPFMTSDGACASEEVNYIDRVFNESAGYFTNENSKAILFRNKVIAHNEQSPSVAWSEIDRDIATLVRIWSLIVSWSSFGRFAAFRTAEQAFSGLTAVFSADELQRLEAKRQEYLHRVFKWAVTYLHSDHTDPGRSGFSKLSVTSTVVMKL